MNEAIRLKHGNERSRHRLSDKMLDGIVVSMAFELVMIYVGAKIAAVGGVSCDGQLSALWAGLHSISGRI